MLHAEACINVHTGAHRCQQAGMHVRFALIDSSSDKSARTGRVFLVIYSVKIVVEIVQQNAQEARVHNMTLE